MITKINVSFFIVSTFLSHIATAQYTVGGINYVNYENYQFWNNSVRDNLKSPITLLGSGNVYFNYHPANKNSYASNEDFSEETEKARQDFINFEKYYNTIIQKNCFLHLAALGGHQYLVNNANGIVMQVDDAAVQEIHGSDDDPGVASSWIINKDGQYFILGQDDTIMTLKAWNYKEIVYQTEYNGNLVLSMRDNNNKMGMMLFSRYTANGELLAPFNFDSVYYFKDYGVGNLANWLVPVEMNGKWGVWNCGDGPTYSNFEVPCIYDSLAFNIGDGYERTYNVKRDGQWLYYNVSERTGVREELDPNHPGKKKKKHAKELGSRESDGKKEKHRKRKDVDYDDYDG
jgi:hypothetical protein